MLEPDALLAAADGSLKEGKWQAAREAFERALAHGEVPEAHLGLATAVWWLGDMRQSVAHLERAYTGFRQRQDPVYSAASALRLAFHYGLHLANPATGAGWLARAARLVDEHALDPLRGELLLVRSVLATDPERTEELARQALSLGRDGADPDLELSALAALGAALVEQGRVSEGVALLDEAMAACLAGEAHTIDTVAFTSCVTMISCANCADFERATQWLRAMERFVERHGSPFHAAECRIVHADLLIARGLWAEAEQELTRALSLAGDLLPAHRADALAMLADLRLYQGRLDEARQLASELEATRRAAPVLARIELLSGNAALAAALASRRLELVGSACLESGRLLELLGEADIARGHADQAGERGQALAELASARGCEILRARGERICGRAQLAAGDARGRSRLQRALGVFQRLGMPYEAARTQQLIAESLRESESELAVSEASAALGTFDKIGAKMDGDACAALLRSWGVRASRTASRGGTTGDSLTKREQEVLALLGQGLSNPAIAARLHLSRKTVEHHVASVLSKLGLRSRAEAAAEAVRRAAGETPRRKLREA